MNFQGRLIRGNIVSAYKDLILDVRFKDGITVPVFCPEMDYLKNLYVPGTEIWVTKNGDRRRRLRYECQLINRGDGLVMVNPNIIDDLFLEAFEKNLLIAILNECGIIMERMKLREEKQNIEIETQQEKLRSNLLRAISHDLRTPLTSISGNASILMEKSESLQEERKQQF